MQKATKEQFVIGLTGGIASGKSQIASAFVRLGAHLIDADAIAHDVLRRPLIVRRLVQEFGPEILQCEGKIDRKRLAELVFGDSVSVVARREALEAVVHPVIHAEAVQRLLAVKSQKDGPSMIVIDAPLLLEAGWDPMCDIIVFVETDEQTRVRRARERGWTELQFHQREDAQMPLGEKKEASTHQISGELDREATDRAVSALVEQIERGDSERVEH